MTTTEHFQALVDVGSNGIRFSISNLSPPTARITPTVYQDRSPISLYDAQHSSGEKLPIPQSVVHDVIAALLRFKRTCHDFGVRDSHVRIVATEATRNAINRNQILGRIKESTGWDVRLLTKEEEGRLGAMGIASSVYHVDGICMDMGGGSIQLTWATTKTTGNIEMGPSVSFPFGAAALMSALSTHSGKDLESLHDDISSKLHRALVNDLQIPSARYETANANGGFKLYLSGGGFRGYGHILMSRENVQPYPIPIINGYSVSKQQFFSDIHQGPVDSSIHRISSRRATQVPAVEALVKALQRAQLPIAQVTFAQGGVREGLLYSELAPPIQAQNPLVVSTLPYSPRSAAQLHSLLQHAIPYTIDKDLLEATINLVYHHGSLPKDIRAAAALRCTSTGILAGAHGLSHRDRQLLALILCERWGGDVSDVDAGFLSSLQNPLGWWTKYIGRAARGIAELFPAGVVRDDEKTVTIHATSPSNTVVESADRCVLELTVHRGDISDSVRAWAADMEKLGKRKHWVKNGSPGREGMKVEVNVIEMALQGG